MNLLLVDNRVSKPDFVVSACLSNIIPVIFDYHNDTVESLIQKIPDGPFISLGIFQENYNEPTYQLLSTMEPASLTFSPETPDFSSWTSLVDFFRAIREKNGISAIDMMGCNIGSDANWLAAIGYIRDTLGIEIASSVDATGGEAAGGNWILETANTDLVGKYFSEQIRGYEFVLGPTSAHSLILTASGEVYSMGSNTSGCSGLGTAYLGYSTITEPMRLGVSGITGVSYGTSNTFLLNSSGQVLCCGENANGQLGLGNTTQQTDLSFVKADANTSLSNVAAVAAGASHTVFLLTDGSALACGLNTNGQLGDGTSSQRTYPVNMKMLDGVISAKRSSLSFYYKFEGNLYNEATKAVDATLNGSAQFVTLSKFGTRCLGLNEGLIANQGSNQGVTISKMPTLTNGNLTVSFWYYVRTTDGGISWNFLWNLGNSTYESLIYTEGGTTLRHYTTKFGTDAGDLTRYITIATLTFNTWHHIAMVASGTTTIFYVNGSQAATANFNAIGSGQTWNKHLIAIGGSNYGRFDEFQLYEDALTASEITALYNGPVSTSLRNMTSISVGTSHTLLSDSSGIAYSCGNSSNGQLGNGLLTDSNFVYPVTTNTFGVLSGVSSVVCGSLHSLALTTSGTVYAWGANTQGQLGRNNNTDSSYAALVLTSGGATLTDITQVAAGTSHSLFLTSTGTVFACGLNTSGQLGNNSTTNSNQLVSVLNPAGTAALTGISKIFASANSSFFLTSSGILYGCGSNASNQLGFPNSGTTIYSLPVQINLVDFGRAKQAGYTALYNRSQGAEPWQQQYYGESALNIGIAGYSATDLSNSGFTATSLKTNGFISEQLAQIGFAEEQAYPPSFISSTASLSAVPTFFTKRANGDFVQSITSSIHNTKIYDISASSHYISGDTAELPPSAFADTLYWSSDAVWNTSTGAYTGSKSTTISGSTYNGEWLQIQLPVAIRLSSYSFIPVASRTPTTFYLAGSSDGTTWTLLDTRTGVTPTAGSTNRYTTTTTQYYHYYRFVVAAVQATNAGYVSLRQFKLNTTVRGLKTGMSVVDLSLAGYDAMDLIISGNPISSIASTGVAISNSILTSLTPKQYVDGGYNYSNIIQSSNTSIIKLAPTTVPASKIGTLMSGGLLDAPRAVTVSGRDASSISVAISGPGFSTGLTGYSVSAVPVTGGSTVAKSLGVAGTLVDGLAAGKIYDLQVRSVGANGNSIPVTLRNSSSLILPSLSVGTRTDSRIDVSFSSAIATQDCSYVLRTDLNATQYILAAGASSQSITGLTSGVTYNIILDASNFYTSVSTIISTSPLFVPSTFFGTATVSTPWGTSGTTDNMGIALDANMSRAIDISLNGFIRLSKNNSGVWSSFTSFDNNIREYTGVALSDDGSIGVASAGFSIASRVFYFTWNNTTQTYNTLNSTSDTTNRKYWGVAMTADGSRIVACENGGRIYFANWNSGSGNYNAFTVTPDTANRSYVGICISRDGSRIAYADQGTGQLFFATWTGNNYSNSTSITTVSTSTGFLRKLLFSYDASLLWIGKYNDTANSLYYTVWNSGTSNYNSTLNAVSTSLIAANESIWGLWGNTTSRKLVVTSYWSNTYRMLDIPVVIAPDYRYTFDTGTQSGNFIKNETTGLYDASINQGVITAGSQVVGTAALSVTTSGTANDYAVWIPTINFANYTQFSISMWFRLRATSINYPWFYSFRLNNTNAYSPIYLASRINSTGGSGNKNIKHYTNGANTSAADITVNLNLQQWYHLAITYNSGTLRTYLDGTIVATQALSLTNSGGSVCTTNWLTSTNDNASGLDYIDDYRFYGYVLTDAQVSSIFNKTIEDE